MRKPLFALVKPLALCFALLLVSCDFLAGPDVPIGQGNVTINIGGEGNLGKAALSADKFRYELTFTGAGQSFTREFAAGNGVLSLELALGTWTISAKAFTERNALIGEGEKVFTVTSGSNSVQISMTAVLDGIFAYREEAGDRIYYVSLQDAITASPSLGGADHPDTITLVKDISITRTSDMITIPSDKWIELVSGSVTRTISRGSALGIPYAGPLIAVEEFEGDQGRLELGGSMPLVIDGNKSSGVVAGAPLIRVKGELTISGANVVLQNNRSSTSGGGVYVDSGAYFIMKAGSIIENEATGSGNGGGVYVNGGNFTMEDSTAKISNNTAFFGGGVYMAGGTFDLNGGTIGGAGTGNTAHYGGGVYVNGTFNIEEKYSATVLIEENVTNANGSGGGVYIETGTVNMISGSITANAASMGGGVAPWGGTFNMSGGTIVANSTENPPGTSLYGAISGSEGMYVSAGNFVMSGTASVNTGNGIYLTSSATIGISGPLQSTSQYMANIYCALENYVTGHLLLSGDLTVTGYLDLPNSERFLVNSVYGHIDTTGFWQ